MLDVRTMEENQTCALPYSRNIPVQQLRDRISELDPDHPVYVYCRSGFRSYLAYRILKNSGFSQVATLSGGTMTMEHAVPWLRAEFELPSPVVTYAEDDRGCVLRVLNEVPFSP